MNECRQTLTKNKQSSDFFNLPTFYRSTETVHRPVATRNYWTEDPVDTALNDLICARAGTRPRDSLVLILIGRQRL